VGYSRRTGRRPMEQASKSAHSFVVNDPTVQSFLARCAKRKAAHEIDLMAHKVVAYQPVVPNPIRHIVAIDSGFTEVAVEKQFPSSSLAYFQFGALTFSIADLEGLERTPFIDPDDMSKLKQIERLKLVLPIRNVSLADQSSLTNSVRAALQEFFQQDRDGTSLLETLRWFLYEEYSIPRSVYELANCPECRESKIILERADVTKDGLVPCSRCHKPLYLIDVFRLHEAIDDDVGAGGILGYVTTLLEQFVMVHFLRLVLTYRPSLLRELLIIKDGPLAFFGQTANMYAKMRALVNYLFTNHDLYMAGLEKSGSFVDHAKEVSTVMKDGSALILDNDYIYKYIIPGKADPDNAYGRTTYYSAKLIFRSFEGGVYVITIPTREACMAPQPSDLHNLGAILTNIEKLRCDMYDDALIPVALVNKLVSLANHPSAKILQRFAVESMSQ